MVALYNTTGTQDRRKCGSGRDTGNFRDGTVTQPYPKSMMEERGAFDLSYFADALFRMCTALPVESKPDAIGKRLLVCSQCFVSSS